MQSGAGKWARILAFNAVGGGIPAAFFLAFNRHLSSHDLLVTFGQGLIFANCIGIPCWLLLPRLAPRFFYYRFPINWMLLVSVLSAIAAVGCLAADLILFQLGLASGAFWAVYASTIQGCLLITLLFGIIGCITEKLRSQLEQTTLALRTRELAEERARKMAAEARLESIEARVHPHFLFNTLNSISSLIREDPERAERVVERLAALLRFSLDTNHASLIPLRREIKIVTDYLEIERARFGARLRYAITLPEELGDCEVPPMSVQTLVENSVKHVVSSRREGGDILVHASSNEDQRLLLEVSDDGPGFDRDVLLGGHGLDLLQGRLDALFGEKASLEIARCDGRSVVTISLPRHSVPVAAL